MAGPRDTSPASGEDSAPLPEGFLTVAHIVKPRGLRGEVSAHLLTDFPENLLKQTTLFLWDGSDINVPREVKVENSWLHGKRLILKFAGCDSIEAAENYAALDVLLPRSKTATLPQGMHYLHELEGCKVVNSEVSDADGGELGIVERVDGAPGNYRLAVRTPKGKELLIPFADEICHTIDTKAKRIEVTLPDGLGPSGQ